jgi:hypothetical protein
MTSRTVLALAFVGVVVLVSGCRAATTLSYEACRYDTDCSRGTDTCVLVQGARGGSQSICTSRCTFGGAACPTDRYGAIGSCVSFDSGRNFFCYQTCAPGSTLCEYGLSCGNVTDPSSGVSTNICLPDGSSTSTVAPYAGCAAGMTCRAGTTCTAVHDRTTIDLCTVSHCSSDADCPLDRRGGNGACISLDGDSFGTCMERCNTTADCTYGSMGVQRCTTRSNGGVTLPPPGVCMP